MNGDDKVVRLYDRDIYSGNQKSDVIPVGYKKDGTQDSSSSAASEADIDVMMKYAQNKAGDFRKEILSGSVRRDPFEYDGVSACDYCQFRSICSGGDSGADGGKRKLEKVDFPGDFYGVH